MKLRLLLLAGLLTLPFAAQAQTTNGRVTTSAPTYTNGTTAPLSLDTSGGTRVNCVTGCSGGTFNNNADAVATQAGNGQTAAYLYGYNGASYDRLRVDSNKYLNVDIQTITATLTLGAGSNVIGHVIADSGSTTAVTGNVATTAADGSSVTLGAKADAKSTATDTTAITIMQVLKEISAMAQAPAALPANQSTNEAQINGVAPLMGNGVSGTGAQRVTIASDSTGQVALAAGSAIVGKVGIDQTTPGTTNGVQVNAALPAGTNLLGKTGIDQTTPGTTNGVSTVAATSGGTSVSTLTLANTTNATNVKNAAGQLYGISGFNLSSATPVWISLYNNSGTPTCGTSIIEQFMIPGSTTGSGFVYDFATPHAYGTGIAFCATTGIAGTGAPAATTYVVNVSFK